MSKQTVFSKTLSEIEVPQPLPLCNTPCQGNKAAAPGMQELVVSSKAGLGARTCL